MSDDAWWWVWVVIVVASCLIVGTVMHLTGVLGC